MLLAGKKANELGHKVVLDPVGAGASRLRTETALNLMKEVKFDVIKGNISEIKTLAYGSGSTRGVDADGTDAVTEEALDSSIAFVKEFAAKSRSVIAITGAIDLVSDAATCYIIRNGRAEMGKITGTGCAMGLAGEIGWRSMAPSDGNSTYRNRMIDAIYHMDGDTLEKGANHEVR